MSEKENTSQQNKREKEGASAMRDRNGGGLKNLLVAADQFKQDDRTNFGPKQHLSSLTAAAQSGGHLFGSNSSSSQFHSEGTRSFQQDSEGKGDEDSQDRENQQQNPPEPEQGVVKQLQSPPKTPPKSPPSTVSAPPPVASQSSSTDATTAAPRNVSPPAAKAPETTLATDSSPAPTTAAASTSASTSSSVATSPPQVPSLVMTTTTTTQQVVHQVPPSQMAPVHTAPPPTPVPSTVPSTQMQHVAGQIQHATLPVQHMSMQAMQPNPTQPNTFVSVIPSMGMYPSGFPVHYNFTFDPHVVKNEALLQSQFVQNMNFMHHMPRLVQPAPAGTVRTMPVHDSGVPGPPQGSPPRSAKVPPARPPAQLIDKEKRRPVAVPLEIVPPPPTPIPEEIAKAEMNQKFIPTPPSSNPLPSSISRSSHHHISATQVALKASSIVKNNKNVKAGMGSDERAHECPFCGKRFSYKGNMVVHIRTHTGEKRYQCNHCMKRFSKRQNLQSHIRTHTGERPYKCSICQREFSRQNNLSRHKRIHSNEKPYQCELCQKKFCSKSNLKSHLVIHGERVIQHCQYCNKSFKSGNYFKKHVQKHRDSKDEEKMSAVFASSSSSGIFPSPPPQMVANFSQTMQEDAVISKFAPVDASPPGLPPMVVQQLHSTNTPLLSALRTSTAPPPPSTESLVNDTQPVPRKRARSDESRALVFDNLQVTMGGNAVPQRETVKRTENKTPEERQEDERMEDVDSDVVKPEYEHSLSLQLQTNAKLGGSVSNGGRKEKAVNGTVN